MSAIDEVMRLREQVGDMERERGQINQALIDELQGRWTAEAKVKVLVLALQKLRHEGCGCAFNDKDEGACEACAAADVAIRLARGGK